MTKLVLWRGNIFIFQNWTFIQYNNTLHDVCEVIDFQTTTTKNSENYRSDVIHKITHSNPTPFFQCYTLPILHSSNPTLFQSYTYTLQILNPFQSHTLQISHSSNLTLFQSYTLPILHPSNFTPFQSHTHQISHSSNLTLFQSNTLTY